MKRPDAGGNATRTTQKNTTSETRKRFVLARKSIVPPIVRRFASETRYVTTAYASSTWVVANGVISVSEYDGYSSTISTDSVGINNQRITAECAGVVPCAVLVMER